MRREDFPVLNQIKPLVYLDTAATAHKPLVVIDAISNFYSKEYATVHRALYSLSANATDRYNAVRSKVQRFLNASRPEEIIFTRGTTDAINLVAKTFIKPGDEVLISEIEHHSNIVPWQLAGATIRTIPVNDAGELEIGSLITHKTKLVSIAHISNTIGVEHDIKKIIDLAHKQGAKVLIDAAQSAPHKALDVQALDVDFLAFSGHKLYGPTGIGILYGKYDLLKELPPYQGGGDMIDQVTFEKTTYNEPPLRFEAGTPPIAEVIGLGAAIDYLTEIGLNTIEHHEQTLLSQLLSSLQSIPGLHILGSPKNRGSLLSFTVEGAHAMDIATLLDLKGIAIRSGHLCSQPTLKRFNCPSLLRVSLGLYTTPEEIDTFMHSLVTILKTIRQK